LQIALRADFPGNRKDSRVTLSRAACIAIVVALAGRSTPVRVNQFTSLTLDARKVNTGDKMAPSSRASFYHTITDLQIRVYSVYLFVEPRLTVKNQFEMLESLLTTDWQNYIIKPSESRDLAFDKPPLLEPKIKSFVKNRRRPRGRNKDVPLMRHHILFLFHSKNYYKLSLRVTFNNTFDNL